MATLFAIHPECDECGAELVKVNSGLVCPNQHGRIVPLEEYVDRSKMPVEHKHLQRMKQTGIATVCRQFARSQRALKRIEEREAKELEKQEARK